MRAALLLLLAACAHPAPPRAVAPAPKPDPAPPGGVLLHDATGIADDEAHALEGPICQGLVEAHRNDITCPTSFRAAFAMRQQRQALAGDNSTSLDLMEQLEQLPLHVRPRVERAAGEWRLTVELQDRQGHVLRSRAATARSLEGLLELADAAALGLLE